MNKELLFAQTLEKVMELAKEQENCIYEEQVLEAFKELELNEEQFQMVYDYLIEHRIGINQPVDLDDYLTEEEKNYLEDYVIEINQLQKPSGGEKEAILISAMAGEIDSCNRVIEIYLADVIEIAKIYTGQGLLLEDLIGEGNLALAIGSQMLGCVESPAEAEGMLIKMVMDGMEEAIAENNEDDVR